MGKRKYKKRGFVSRASMYFVKYGEAEKMFLSGHAIGEISVALGVSAAELTVWSMEGAWLERARMTMGTPRGAAWLLREDLRRKVEDMHKEGLTVEGLKELDALAGLLGKLEGKGYQYRGAVVEVFGKFGRWLKTAMSEEDSDIYFTMMGYMNEYMRLVADES